MKGIFKIIDSSGNKEVTNNPIELETQHNTQFIINDILPNTQYQYSIYQYTCTHSFSNLGTTYQVKCMDYVLKRFSNNPVCEDTIKVLKSIVTKTPYECKYHSSLFTIRDLANILNFLDTYEHGLSENGFSIFSLYCHMKLMYKNNSETIISNIIKLMLSEYRFLESINGDIRSMMTSISGRYHIALRDLVEYDTLHGCIHIPFLLDNGVLPKVFIPNPNIPVEHYDYIIQTYFPSYINYKWEDKSYDDKSVWDIVCKNIMGYGAYFNGIFMI